MKKPLLAAAAGFSLAASANASLLEIDWDPQNAFRHSNAIAAGGFAEVCGELKAQERVVWSFKATAELDFNIHYHEGDKVNYPVKSPQVRSLADQLTAPVDQTYCWMWTNTLDAPVPLTVELFRGR